jgi:hypothetical protein
MKNKIVHFSIIGIFVSLYVLVATISMINSVDFFDISHNRIMSWTLALGFELGAAASLAAILILERTSKVMVWGLFILLTSFQMMANSYHAYINLENYIPWIELFGLTEEDPLTQKRILSIISGAILPIVALGFIKSLTDYIKPKKESEEKNDEPESIEEENLFDLLDNEDEPSLSDLDRFYEQPIMLQNDIELEEASLTDLNKFYEEEEIQNDEEIEEVQIVINSTQEVKEEGIEEEIIPKTDTIVTDSSSANSRDKLKNTPFKTDNTPVKRHIRTVTEVYKP